MISKEVISIAICQFNAHVGEIDKNARKIIQYIHEAESSSTDLLIFPELTLTGYTPLDFLYYLEISSQIEEALKIIQSEINTDITIILGAPELINDVAISTDRRYYNVAIVMTRSGIVKKIKKSLIPNYGIFHEKRYFVSGINDLNTEPGIISIRGHKIGIQICEDMWSNLDCYSLGDYKLHETNISNALCKNGAEIIVNISASPYSKSKIKERIKLAGNHAVTNNVPFIYVNDVGAIDELIFDGGSFVVNNKGNLIFGADLFEEGLFHFNSDQFDLEEISDEIFDMNYNLEVIKAISLNLQNYLRNINFQGKTLIALSGGIDSAVTATLCVYALGHDKVIGIYMPSEFSSNQSKVDAEQLAINLGIDFHVLSISDIQNIALSTINTVIPARNWSIADENIQARIRGVLMMYFSNFHNHLVISTGNKSEIAVGYCTLYGDTIGAKNLIGDLYKTQVFELAKYFKNDLQYGIPESIINKPPSAELRPNQLDSDSLPEYKILDKILSLLVDSMLSRAEIISFGIDHKIVDKVISLVKGNEFKRAQLPQTVRLTENAFGTGRLFPIGANLVY